MSRQPGCGLRRMRQGWSMAMGVAMGMMMAVIVWNHSEMLYYNITSAKAFVDGYGDGGGQER